MKKKAQRPPTRSELPVLRQLGHLIPPRLVAHLARALGTEKLARTFSHWRHVVALLYAQLTHASSRNDVCDSRRLHSGPRSAVRGATPPSKNGLSRAHKERDPALAEALCWQMLRPLARPLSGPGRTRGPPLGRALHPHHPRRRSAPHRTHRLARRWAVTRSALWRLLGVPEQAYLPGMR